MSFYQNLSLFSVLLTVALPLSQAATFNINNSCQFTVWAAAVPGGGRQLDGGQTWTLNVNAGTENARIWARTNCIFDGASGKSQTGDCGSLLECQTSGQPPNTLAEYSLNQFNNLDFIDISLVDGFNVPMEFSPTSVVCDKVIRCTANINGQCPDELKAPGGCNNPCTVFKTYEYCCNSNSCGPTNYSRFFKDRCPVAYSYPKDDPTSTFTCPGGTNYKVVLCPNDRISSPVPEQFDGRGPNTIAEYGTYRNTTNEYFSISLVNGFNIPMEFSPISNSEGCHKIKCAADINGPCPMELRDRGGCNNPCTIFGNDQFCCHSRICEPTSYSEFFKNLCPDAYTYPSDTTGLFSCPNATDYNVVFCP